MVNPTGHVPDVQFMFIFLLGQFFFIMPFVFHTGLTESTSAKMGFRADLLTARFTHVLITSDTDLSLTE